MGPTELYSGGLQCLILISVVIFKYFELLMIKWRRADHFWQLCSNTDGDSTKTDQKMDQFTLHLACFGKNCLQHKTVYQNALHHLLCAFLSFKELKTKVRNGYFRIYIFGSKNHQKSLLWFLVKMGLFEYTIKICIASSVGQSEAFKMKKNILRNRQL